MMISYAQNLEDVLLWRCLKNVKDGFYIDVGAHHSEIDSVTKWFYDKNWHGINIEPVQELFREIEKNRPRDINLNVAAGDGEEDANFYLVKESPGLSSLKSREAYSEDDISVLNVKKRSLNGILHEYPVTDIHFLKIDVEGAEYDVIKGINLKIFRPWIIVSESISGFGIQNDESDLINYITSNNYKKAWFDGLNSYFIASERSDLFDIINVQPNIFDNFVLSKIVSLQNSVGRLENSLSESQEMIQSQDKVIQARDAQVFELETSISKSEKIIQNQDIIINERNIQINVLENDVLTEHRNIIDNLEKRVSNLVDKNSYLTEIKDIIESSNGALIKEISNLNDIINKERNNAKEAMLVLNASEELVRSYENSTSWKMTAPVRAMKRRIRDIIRL